MSRPRARPHCQHTKDLNVFGIVSSGQPTERADALADLKPGFSTLGFTAATPRNRKALNHFTGHLTG